MLLQALHDYAVRKKLLPGLPFQVRKVHWLLPLTADGEVRCGGFLPLSVPPREGEDIRYEAGRAFLLPRLPGENNGGKAHYLVESFATLFGVRKQAGATLPPEPGSWEDRNLVFSHRHFWQQIAEAYARTNDARLRALLAFRDHYLSARDGSPPVFEWLAWLPNESSRKKEPEWHGRTAAGPWVPLNRANIIAFEVEGVPLAVPADDPLRDPLWQDWGGVYRRQAFAHVPDDPEGGRGAGRVCLITGANDVPIARSHKPKILGVPGLLSGGYVVSFAKHAPAFSSYGFERGENASVSQEAAAAYSLALNDLLASDETCFKVGDVAFCFWAGEQTMPAVSKFRMLFRAGPGDVTQFLNAPFEGIDRNLARQEDFFAVALSANAGRVVIRQWMRSTLEQGLLNLKQWFEQLEIAPLGRVPEKGGEGEEKGGPYSLFRLALGLVRGGSESRRIGEVVCELHPAALGGFPPPVQLLGHLLSEFRSALRNDLKKPSRYPFSRSRFALLKLILTRQARGGFVPSARLIYTDDKAYNLGRLLCILASLQKAVQKRGEVGGGGGKLPSIVASYYGPASSTPAAAFGLLWRLHRHHLWHLEREGQSGVRLANSFRARIAQVIAVSPPGKANEPPAFPVRLGTEEQGRFALGFYQQMAHDRAAASVRGLLRQARKAARRPDEVRALIAQAREKAESLGYEDLARLASAAEKRCR